LCGQIDEITTHTRLMMKLMVSLQSNDGCYWSLEWWIVVCEFFQPSQLYNLCVLYRTKGSKVLDDNKP